MNITCRNMLWSLGIVIIDDHSFNYTLYSEGTLITDNYIRDKHSVLKWLAPMQG